ncbi:MAG: OmpA family protein [Ferruginibacter sp.]
MKKQSAIVIAITCISFTANSQLIKKLGDKVKTKTSQRADQKADNAIDKALDKTEVLAKSATTNTSTTTTTTTDATLASTTTQPAMAQAKDTPVVNPAAFKAYQNYDFVPGEKILFEDHFADDQTGEFPAHWELQNGQAVINDFNGKKALLITDGNAGWVSPLMKKKKYLDKEWTLEFDNWKKAEAYQLRVYLQDESHNDLGSININSSDMSVKYLTADGAADKTLIGNYPEEIRDDNFLNKWHHIAIAYKDKQIKVYVDQTRVVVVPNSNLVVGAIGLGGIGSQDGPLIFTNVRIAEGAGMNMLGKKFTDTKIVTHGINFDVNKAIIKPESMGTLNGIVQILKDNPDVKFEVGGHTDSDGDDAANMKLSQARADAVRNQLITMGVAAARLTTKGYGETKPISDNTSMEGKANNRRVEFVKK